MIKLECCRQIIERFERESADQLPGYDSHGNTNIERLEKINNIISGLGLIKLSHKKSSTIQKGTSDNENCVLRCINGRLDMNSAAIYYCAFYIKAGLHPVLIYYSDCVGIGVWMNDRSKLTYDDNDSNYDILNRYTYPEKDNLLLIDTWDALGNKSYDFWGGLHKCISRLSEAKCILDITELNEGNSDCILYDERPYMTEEKTREKTKTTLFSKKFLSGYLHRDFRNVHFISAFSEYEESVSDMIQTENSFFIKNMPADKQVMISVDAAMNSALNDKRIFILANNDMFQHISDMFCYMDIYKNEKLIDIVDDSRFMLNMDYERPIDVLKNIIGENRKKDHIRKAKKKLPETLFYEADLSDQAYENFDDNDIEQFKETALKKTRLSAKPAGLNGTFYDMYNKYKECRMDKISEDTYSNDMKAIFNELKKYYFGSGDHIDSLIDNMQENALYRKESIISIGDRIFDIFYFFKDNKNEYYRFKNNIDSICEYMEKLDNIYLDISGEEKESDFSFECMMEYKSIFMDISSSGTHVSCPDYSVYEKYLEYKELITSFAGSDIEKILDQYSDSEKKQLIDDIETVMIPAKYDRSQNYKTARSNVSSLIQKITSKKSKILSLLKIMPPDDVLEDLKAIITARSAIGKFFDTVRNTYDIFAGSVNEKNFSRLYIWTDNYLKIKTKSGVAEEIARKCINDEEFYEKLHDCIILLNDCLEGVNSEIHTNIKNIKSHTDNEIYEKYLDTKEYLIKNGMSDYVCKIEESTDKNYIETVSVRAVNFMYKIFIEDQFSANHISIPDVPFIDNDYDRLLKKVRDHYVYILRNGEYERVHIVICADFIPEFYADSEYDKFIVCGADNIDYDTIGEILEKSSNVVVLAENDVFNDDSIASLMTMDMNAFDYSKNLSGVI